jgi:hypothetical protein
LTTFARTAGSVSRIMGVAIGQSCSSQSMIVH